MPLLGLPCWLACRTLVPGLALCLALPPALQESAPTSSHSARIETQEASATSEHVLRLRETAVELKQLIGAGELERASQRLGRAVRAIEATEEGATPEEVEVLGELGDLCFTLSAPEAQLAIRRRALRLQEALLPPDHLDLLEARSNLAKTMYELEDYPGAVTLLEDVHAAYTRLLPEDDAELLAVRANLGVARYALGDFAGARELQEKVLQAYERVLPEDHPDLVMIRYMCAASRSLLGDMAGALELLELVVATGERLYSDDDTRLIDARVELARTKRALGDFEGALALQLVLLEAMEKVLPEAQPDLLDARIDVAVTRHGLGQLEDAEAIMESVLEVQERALPAEHPDLLATRSNLAVMREELGDIEGALALLESVHAVRERTLPEDDHRLVTVRMNLAGTRAELGDLEGALALDERVVAANERSLPEDHPDLLMSRANLANTKLALGDHEGAFALQVSVLEAYERLLPEGHPSLLSARTNLANTLLELGDLESAMRLQESVLEERERVLPDGHVRVLKARDNLAQTKRALGDLEGAHALQLEALAACRRTLPADHPAALQVRDNLARTLLELDELEDALALLPELVEGMLSRLEGALASSPREARAIARSDANVLHDILHIAELGGSLPDLATLVETRRHVATAVLGAGRGDELSSLRSDLAGLRARLNDLVLGGAAEGRGTSAWKAEIEQVSLQRDRVQRELRQRLQASGDFVGRVEPKVLAERLPGSGLAIGYLRYDRWGRDPETHRFLLSEPSLLALAIGADGAVRRVEIGTVAEVEELVRAWREALGKPLVRGLSAGQGTVDEERLGRELRRKLLDPVLAAAGDLGERGDLDERTTLLVCPDDLLHLVPFDALPLEQAGARLGDRYRVRSEISFARTIAGRSRGAAEAERGGQGLLVLGDVDFERRSDAALDAQPVAASTTPPSDPSRAAVFGSWPRLFGTRGEVRAIAALYEESFGEEPALLTRGEATKAALFEGVRGKRFVHLATHGWFAPETVLSAADAAPRSDGFEARLERTVRGLAPMTLCGLCLAGANLGRDSVGRVPGLITAEELAGYDLSACELAVLSACETNVGIHRAGQGILSLQTALHAAGARSAITSLWRVDDDLTQELMQELYTNLWERGMSKADALWAAKTRLREGDFPVSAWAAWVLTGDPD